ncbi:hypothetical protein O181_001813 [Austropuccinia psidii MF-1]|uniref:Uncharacterized protein n=1 Tax=Austropuccinia psidii MF-1 TaxID=1389203 RepID=A0A9Q3GC27_9BASI|nr:hypothetical protein [Austropuccinia psidii MF-1]
MEGALLRGMGECVRPLLQTKRANRAEGRQSERQEGKSGVRPAKTRFKRQDIRRAPNGGLEPPTFRSHSGNPPVAGSSSRPDEHEEMRKAISQRDEVIAKLMQQAEDEAAAVIIPSVNNNTKKDKGKGHLMSSEDQLRQRTTPISNRPPASQKRINYTVNNKVSVKRNPIQMLMREAPPDFKYTKEALYVHIKLLWGMLTPAAMPTAPDKQLLKEFYQRFSSVEEVQSVAQNSQGVKLINEAQVQTLRDARSGKRKVGKNIINMQDFYITYVHAMLAKLGIRIWAPDLEEAPDSLYNEACRIVALMTFRQIACSGAYQYMRANFTYCNDLGLLRNAYDHYVHYVLAEKYRREGREKGWNERDVERKVVQRARQRLRDNRYKFLIAHNYPKRYQVIASDVNAHSDDEYNAKAGVYVIKTLAYRSDSATAFFRRLDSKIKDVDRMMGRRSYQRIRRRPKKPILSKFEKTPKNIPIDFYRPEWFNEKNHSQKIMVADLGEVAFVPTKNLPPGSKEHPDERLGDLTFSNKYWDSVSKDYQIEPGTPENSDSVSLASSDGDESIDLDAAANERDVDNNLVEEELIKHEESEVEFAEEEKDSVSQNDEDVLMFDAWETRKNNREERRNSFEDEGGW